MDTHRTHRGGTDAPLHGRPGGARSLPLAARRALWRRAWERLLAPPPDAGGDAPAPDPDGTGTTRGDDARREGR